MIFLKFIIFCFMFRNAFFLSFACVCTCLVVFLQMSSSYFLAFFLIFQKIIFSFFFLYDCYFLYLICFQNASIFYLYIECIKKYALMHKGVFCRFLFYELNISLNSSPSIFSFSINIFATLVNLSIFIFSICSAVLYALSIIDFTSTSISADVASL